MTISFKKLFSIILGACFTTSLALAETSSEFPSQEDLKMLKRNETLRDYQTLHQLVDSKGKGMIWLFTGDISTQGGNYTNNERTYGQHWEQLIKWEHKRYNDIVINTGRLQNTLGTLNSQFPWMIGNFGPQVVAVNLGLEGIDKFTAQTLRDYQGELYLLLSNIRNIGAIPVIQIPGAAMEKEDTNPMIKQLQQTIMQACDREKVIVVDHLSHWDQHAPPPSAEYAWVIDGIYPNGQGHREIFKKLALDLGFYEMAKKLDLDAPVQQNNQ